jgi:hypothetical protein
MEGPSWKGKWIIAKWTPLYLSLNLQYTIIIFWSFYSTDIHLVKFINSFLIPKPTSLKKTQNLTEILNSILYTSPWSPSLNTLLFWFPWTHFFGFLLLYMVSISYDDSSACTWPLMLRRFSSNSETLFSCLHSILNSILGLTYYLCVDDCHMSISSLVLSSEFQNRISSLSLSKT